MYGNRKLHTLNLNKLVVNISINKINKFFFSQKVKLDPYLILEVNRNADWKTIKLSYFKLARLYHPDLNKNDEVIIIIFQQ
jgi:DnaJ-class molecular chaperone